MIQLYFLSILCNSLAGYILFSGNDSEMSEKTGFSIHNPTFYLILGILSIVTGVLKLLSPSLDGLVIIGDLIPAASGVIAGLILIFGLYRKDSFEKTGELDRFGKSLIGFRKPIGLGLFIVALLHFLFPKALFL